MQCPKCKSSNITTNNKGYGIGKGVIGSFLLGPLGLIAGNIGRYDIMCTCLDCGHRWSLKYEIKSKENKKILKKLLKTEEKKQNQKERILKAKTAEFGTICPVCGEKKYDDKQFCPICSAKYIPEEEINDRFMCGRYEKALKKNHCIYFSDCIHEDCQFCKSSKSSSGLKLLILFIILFFIVEGLLYICFHFIIN